MINKKDWIIAGVFLLLSIGLIFYKLDARPLQDWDEGIYANISSEMVTNGDYWHLTSGGNYWYEKEPLPFWLMAGSIKVFGFNVWALRFSMAIFCIFIFPLFYLLTRKFLSRLEAVLSTAFFVVSPVVWHSHFLRTADFDMLAVCLILSALAAYVYKRESSWWLTGILLASLCLVRGVWGFFFLGMVLILDFFQTKRWSWKKIVGVIIITTSPWLFWHLWSLSFGGLNYVKVYWQEQFFSRVTGPLQGHQGGIDFYWNFLRILLGWPWLLFLVLAVIFLIIRYIKKPSSTNLFLPLWLLISLVPLHIISTKINWYLAPALPAIYLAFGSFLEIIKKALWQSKFKYKKILWGLFIGFWLFLMINFASLSFVKVSNYTNEKLTGKNPEWPAVIWYKTYTHILP